MSTANVVSIGSEVFTTDGEWLGEVREIRPGSFRLTGAVSPDYWLPSNEVASVMGKRITLAFARDRLDHYRSALPFAA